RLEKARGFRFGVFLLRAQREAVRGLPGYCKVAADVVGGLRHGVLTETLADLRIGGARADGGIEDADVAGVGALALRHDEGRAAHALDAASDEEVALAAARGARGIADGGEAAAAEAVDGDAADRGRQARQQCRMPRYVPRVLAGLVGAAHDR